MEYIYIRETKDTCDIVKRILLKIKYFFGVIKIEKLEEKTIYNLPIFPNKKISKKKTKKLSKMIIKYLEKEGIYNIILSKYLCELQNLKNNFHSNNIKILDGRYLFKNLTYEIIEYISKRKNKNIQETEIAILVNDFNDINKEIIIYIAKNVKTLSIITNHINKCKNIENYLYNEFGILLNVLNNKKTSICNSEIILNFDFPEELLNQYNIYDKAVIINFLGKVLIKSKKFNGINVNHLKISIPNRYKLEGFKEEEIYESIIYKKTVEEVRKKFFEDEVKIKRLVGNNGIISDREFINRL